MIKIVLEFKPSPSEIEKNFPINELPVEDFLEWITSDDVDAMVKEVNLRQERLTKFNEQLKECDTYYKNLILSYFTPFEHKFNVHRNNNNQFYYTIKMDLDYSKEKLEDNLFDLKCITNFDFLRCNVVEHITKQDKKKFLVAKDLFR